MYLGEVEAGQAAMGEWLDGWDGLPVRCRFPVEELLLVCPLPLPLLAAVTGQPRGP